ncbi:MAG: DUF5765 domain-containing protein [Alphaproteobacteria bacterium]|nr:DUF5765 domain-containing protein [Alphaproteobacteria bacterium]
MCWSGEASAALATAGFCGVAWAAYKKEPVSLWICLGYFSLMELLQAFTYSVIDQCGAASNQIATLFGYLHISFQPFFINAISMYFVPKGISKRIAPAVYAFCFFSAIFMLLQLYPFDWAGHCTAPRSLCGQKLCSVHGNWHIAWLVPLNGLCENPDLFGIPWLTWIYKYMLGTFPTYVFAGFMLPVLYGSWRFTVYHILMGPFLAALLTNNLNERPAVWCLLSIGLLLLVVKTPLRKILFVRQWFLWPQQWVKTGRPRD